jgi:hypothetical protein
VSFAFRRAVSSDFPEVRRITHNAYLRAGHFAADHPYLSMLDDVEHRTEHAEVRWRRHCRLSASRTVS